MPLQKTGDPGQFGPVQLFIWKGNAVGQSTASHYGRRGGAEPARVRNRIARPQEQSARRDHTPLAQGVQQRCDHEMGLVARHLMGALTKHLDLDAPSLRDLQCQFIEPVYGQPHAVESRPQVGCTCRDTYGESHLPSMRM